MNRKEMRRQYEQIQTVKGCYLLTCSHTNERYIGISHAMEKVKDRIFFRLSVGALANLSNLQTTFATYGEESLHFEIIQVLPQTEDETSIDEDLAILLQLQKENFPDAKEIQV